MSELTAARLDDPLVHSSALADLVSGLVEGAIYTGILVGAGMLFAVNPVAGVAVGAGLMIGAMASGYPEKLGNQASDAVDGLLDTLGMRGPPDAVITSGSDNVNIMGKPAARAAGTVNRDWLATSSDDSEEAPGLKDIAMAVAGGIASTVRHPGAAISSAMDKISHLSAASVGSWFGNLWDDLVQPTVASASPYATPANKDTVACTKGHLAENANFLAEGSKKVFINGHPAVRNGHRSTCEATIQVSENPRVRIGGDSVVVRDIRSGKNMLAYFVGGLLSGGIGKEGAKLLEQLFSRIAARRALRQITCTIVSEAGGTVAAGAISSAAMQSFHPVNYATGAKILAGQDDLDFVLEDRIPLYWQRIYHSRNLNTGMFGTGWMMPFETRLIRFRDEDGSFQFAWRDVTGQELGLGEIAPGDVVRFDEDGFTLFCSLQGVIVMQTAQGEFHLYEPDPLREGEWRIGRIYDRHENCQHLTWNEAGQLVAIAGDNEALDVRLSYEPLHGRVTAIDQVVGDELRPLMRYSYNSQGQLIAVQDADDVETRRFSWDRASDLMASHSYATGMSVEYQWQPATDSRYWRVYEYQVVDEHKNCLEHWLIDADEEARSATVTCFSGGTTQHRWDNLCRITDYIDSYGAHWSYRWAEQGELLMATRVGDRVWEYDYDERANLAMVRDPAGRTSTTIWHPSYAFPLKEVQPDGAVWQYQYNDAGDVVAVTDPLGGTSRFTWNEQGDLITRTDALENTHRFWWNERGQLQRDEDCSGHQSHRRYDDAGRLLSSTDAEGNTTRYRWSKAGRLQCLTRADGRETEYEYDRAGMLVGENVDSFSERHVTRNVRGQIVSQTDPAGHITRYQYDRFGRMTALINPNGDRWQFEYDNSQRLLAQVDYAGRRKSYGYDELGQVTEVVQHPLPVEGENLQPYRTRFEYDEVSRLTVKTTQHHRTEYHYGPDSVEVRKIALAEWQKARSEGREAEAEVLALTSDALGNLLSEENSGGLFSHQYDALGNLSSTTLPDGRELNCLRYGTGHLLQMNLKQHGKQTEIAGYQRDKLHREIDRTQGALHQETRYDPAGRIVMRRSGFIDRSGVVFERRYRWDPLDQVMQQMVLDSATRQNEWANQQQRFGYDAAGKVTREVRADKEEHFSWDAAGNQTEKPGETVWRNLLLRLKGARWRYDGFGRMTWRKASSQAVEQHFSYDDEHRISEVRFDGHKEFSRAEYRYDAVGRRIQKILYRHGKEAETVTFIWSGLRMVGESSSLQPARNTQYIYSENSREPLARVNSIGGQSDFFWYHTELNGLPERMTDEHGEVV